MAGKAKNRPTLVIVCDNGVIDAVLRNRSSNVEEVVVVNIDDEADQRYAYRTIDRAAIPLTRNHPRLQKILSEGIGSALKKRLTTLVQSEGDSSDILLEECREFVHQVNTELQDLRALVQADPETCKERALKMFDEGGLLERRLAKRLQDGAPRKEHVYPDWCVFPQETWDEAQCRKVASHMTRDGLGTPYPWRGLVQCSGSARPQYGQCTLNGGYSHGGRYYRLGYKRPYPKLHEKYVYVHHMSWGVFIMARKDVTDEEIFEPEVYS